MENILAERERGGEQSFNPFSAIGCRLHFFLYFLDILALALAALTTYLLLSPVREAGRGIHYGILVVIVGLAYSVYGFSNGLYDWRSFRQRLKAPMVTFGGAIFAFGALLLIAFVFRITADFSRLWIVSWFASFVIYLVISRVVVTGYLSDSSNRGVFSRKAVILGAGENGQAVLDHMLRFESQDIRVIGFLDDRKTRLPNDCRGVPVLGGLQLAERLVRECGVDVVIVALPWCAHERIDQLIKDLSTWRVDIFLAPDKPGIYYADHPVLRVGGMPVLSLRHRPISEWSAVVKRIEDIFLVVPALVVLFPVLAIAAIAIKLESKGDVLFIQKRFGFNNEVFNVYKFRSMYADMADITGAQRTVKSDPRVTKVGLFIRKTSIDELPQLFNVLLGNMSIVGPRPHATEMQLDGQLLDQLMRQYASRHRVKPGLTGWAQCHGWRGEADTLEKIEKRVEYDLYYIENWSVILDLLVIVKTALQLFKGQDNAY